MEQTNGIKPHTRLRFQEDGKLHSLSVTVQAVIPFNDLAEANRVLFKAGGDADYAVVTNETIFHPQGGGQPSDTGTISNDVLQFQVSMARMDAIESGQVLHFGRFNGDSSQTFSAGDEVLQTIDVERRELYSRYHTAGHVLGAAVRHLLENEIPGFDELKASHFPDSASCEFQGSIEGKWKESIQKQVDDYIQANMPVEIDWWSEEDFARESLERLVPDKAVFDSMPDRKLRVVKIVGAEVYPCGGTHVDSTMLCGKTNVRKISRTKGQSRVSYAL